MKHLKKSIGGIVVLLFIVILFFSTKSNPQTAIEPVMDSILSDTHKIDKKLNSGNVTWMGIDVKRNDQNDTRNYELWRIYQNEEPLMIENFWLSTPYSDIQWNLNEKGGLNVKTSIGGGDAATMTDIVYDYEGIEQFKIIRESRKDYYFTFQQNNRAEFELSALIEGVCSEEALFESGEYILPEVTLQGVQLKRLAANRTVEDFLFADPTKVQCEQNDGLLVNPNLEILNFDDGSIEFSFSNGQKGKILLKPFPDEVEIILQ